jgi:peptide/nickel transport system substrate-binding protein
MRRLLALLLIPALALAAPACRSKPQGTVDVVVIGDDEPKLRDPVQGDLAAPDAVLLQNVAQGLVQFDAGGDIVGGLAERWNVSDDGLSYIFRIAATDWPDGRKVNAQQVARLLKRQIAARSKNDLKDALGAVEDIVAMTDRVIEIRLLAPRPNLLALLAQPEFAVLRDGRFGTGPFHPEATAGPHGEIRLVREVGNADEDTVRREEVLLSAAGPAGAVRAFAAGVSDLVLGGTLADLPYAREVKLPRGSLRFDPASGLFGLVPVQSGGPLDKPEVRRLLSQAIDRATFVNALGVPGLAPRATLLEPGLDELPPPAVPSWLGAAIGDRRPALIADANRLLGKTKPLIRVALPAGPGADLLFAELRRDWGVLGLTVERVGVNAAADFRLVDEVAPSTSPAWFVRRFRCGTAPVCNPDLDALIDAARASPVPAQRYALLGQAAAQIDDAQLFIPITAPVRWSLVAARLNGFAGNRFARHTLTDLEQKPGSGE